MYNNNKFIFVFVPEPNGNKNINVSFDSSSNSNNAIFGAGVTTIKSKLFLVRYSEELEGIRTALERTSLDATADQDQMKLRV